MDMEEEELVENENTEPQVTSEDPAERIAARRLRIEKRVEALRKQREVFDVVGEEVSTVDTELKKTQVDVQLEKSLEVLEKLIEEGDEYVTNVRVATEAREADRREREGLGKEKLIQELEEEASAAADMFEEVTSKWLKILKLSDPLYLNEEMTNQKEKCDELIKLKDALIANLKAKIRSAEINFGIDQQRQIEDINSITRRIENQIMAMRKAFRQELQMVEGAIIAERQILIEVTNKKWEDLYKKRDQEEKSNAEQRSEDYWNFVDELDNLNRDFGELYRETTIHLENDIDDVQREMERIKRDAIINCEKLDYNYQIFKKREDENMIIRSQQKRRINKLQDVINCLRKKNSVYHQQTTQQIEKLTEEVKKLTQNILDIERKADHTAKVNNTKFNEVWKMNVDRANELYNTILAMDRVIYEQHLGLMWTTPETEMPDKMQLVSYKAAINVIKSNKAAEKTSTMSTFNACERENPNYKRLIKKVLELVADKTGFLIEDEVMAILDPYMDQDKTLVKIEDVFSALNIKNKDDIDLLFDHFVPYMHCPFCSEEQEKKPEIEDESEMRVYEIEPIIPEEVIPSKVRLANEAMMSMLKEVPGIGEESLGVTVECGPLEVILFDRHLKGECKGPDLKHLEEQKESVEASLSDGNEQERASCHLGHPLTISPVYVLTALNQFLEKYHVAQVGLPTMTSRLLNKRSTVSRMIDYADLELFWDKYYNIFPSQRLKLWDSLQNGLKQYHELLKVRKTTSEEVVKLRQQNEELRRVFANYIEKKDIPYNMNN